MHCFYLKQNLMKYKGEFLTNGFAITDNIYTTQEVEKILLQINQANSNKETFRKSTDLFAIRQFLKEVPGTIDTIFNDKLKSVLEQLFGGKYFVVKSIY